MNDEHDRSSAAPDVGTIGHAPATPQAGNSSPTFPSEAESLLKHLRLGAPRPAVPDRAPGAFPRIPNYEFECELGRGGMGVVYKARHAALRHAVAVKMILTSAHASPGEVARFVAEAEAIAAVTHPNVVQVYDLGEADGQPYFVMEYVAGGNLAGLLKGGPLPPTRAAALIEAVARGVQAAHDAGIVHRDLKPANILLGKDEGSRMSDESKRKANSGSDSSLIIHRSSFLPKVSDFGLAKRLSSDMTRSQAVVGTPAYMAPEQAGGKAKFVGPQADVYALGVILYECLIGRTPFHGDDPWALIRQVLDDAPPPPRALAPGVPRDLELIGLKCLEKEPHHRYPTAAALADDLTRFLAGEPVSVRPLGVPTRACRWAKKRPAAAVLSVLGVLSLLVVPALTVGVQGRLDSRDAVAVEAQKKEVEAKRAEDEARRAEAEAKRAEDEARRARAEAEKARVAAERLAEARELFALQNAFRNRAAARPLGWTTATRDELPRAVVLAGGDPRAVEDLRSTAAAALLAPDLFPAEPVAGAINGAALATDPNTGLVAVGEQKAWGMCRVLLIDPATGRTVRQLTYPVVAVKGKGWVFDVVQDGTRALAFSPDGTRLFVGTRSSRVMRFDLDGPKNTPAAIWNASAAPVEQLGVSPDGKTVYGLCKPEVPVFAWDADTGAARTPFTPVVPTRVYSFAVLPSGELIAGTGDRLYRWRADGALVRSAPNAPSDRLAPAGGSLLLVGSGGRLGTYDLDTFTPTDALTDPKVRRGAHEDGVRVIAVHPSGAYAATAAGDAERTVKVWGLASGRLVGTVFAPGTGPIALAWSGDGGFLLATACGHVARWRFVPGGAQRFACGSAFALEAAALLPDGRVAALSESVGRHRELLVGPPGARATGFELLDAGGGGRAGLSADPAGALAFTLDAPGLLLWKPDSPFAPPDFAKQPVQCPRYGRDGRTLWAVFGSKEVRALDAATRARRGAWNNSFGEVLSGLATMESLAAGRDLAAAGGRDGSVYLLNAACEVIGTFPGPGDPVLAVAVAPDDALIVAGTQNGKVRVIRTADRTELAAVPAHPGGTTAVSVSRDGALLATGGRDRTVRLWKRAGDRFEPLLAVADLPGGVRDVQFGPTGGSLLVLLVNERAARVWDVDKLSAQLAELKLGW